MGNEVQIAAAGHRPYVLCDSHVLLGSCGIIVSVEISKIIQVHCVKYPKQTYKRIIEQLPLEWKDTNLDATR